MADALAEPPPSLLDGAALFLDFDGTLVELAEAPDAIEVPSDLHPMLERLARRLAGRVAIISGRSIGDLKRHLGRPRIALSGSHGLELLFPDGSHVPVAAPAGLAEARAEVTRFAARDEGLLVEEKPAGIALHFRLAPEQGDRVAAFLTELAERTGLAVQHGKMVAELRPAGRHKGDALRALMAEPAFVGARPVFVGDDLTDEDAFAAAGEMGGGGILVGPPRTSAARWRLADVGAVARWLQDAIEAADG
jgi:trehalose 6-phosphate phosphatase